MSTSYDLFSARPRDLTWSGVAGIPSHLMFLYLSRVFVSPMDLIQATREPVAFLPETFSKSVFVFFCLAGRVTAWDISGRCASFYDFVRIRSDE